MNKAKKPMSTQGPFCPRQNPCPIHGKGDNLCRWLQPECCRCELQGTCAYCLGLKQCLRDLKNPCILVIDHACCKCRSLTEPGSNLPHLQSLCAYCQNFEAHRFESHGGGYETPEFPYRLEQRTSPSTLAKERLEGESE